MQGNTFELTGLKKGAISGGSTILGAHICRLRSHNEKKFVTDDERKGILGWEKRLRHVGAGLLATLLRRRFQMFANVDVINLLLNAFAGAVGGAAQEAAYNFLLSLYNLFSGGFNIA
jgi:hypothetical protein